MPSERDIDNYINEIEENNQIYMEEELEYAKKCHNLEEQLGCPLEVVFKALKYGIIIKDMFDIGIGNKFYGVRLDTQNYDCEYVLRTYKGTISVEVKNYKKTWWLKEDRSE